MRCSRGSRSRVEIRTPPAKRPRSRSRPTRGCRCRRSSKGGFCTIRESTKRRGGEFEKALTASRKTWRHADRRPALLRRRHAGAARSAVGRRSRVRRASCDYFRRTFAPEPVWPRCITPADEPAAADTAITDMLHAVPTPESYATRRASAEVVRQDAPGRSGPRRSAARVRRSSSVTRRSTRITQRRQRQLCSGDTINAEHAETTE